MSRRDLDTWNLILTGVLVVLAVLDYARQARKDAAASSSPAAA